MECLQKIQDIKIIMMKMISKDNIRWLMAKDKDYKTINIILGMVQECM
jgi:hypothetical protein